MSITITNYDGEKGYLPGDKLPSTVFESDGIKYIINFLEPLNRDGVFKITHEGEEEATAIEVTDKGLIERLEQAYFAELE